MQLDWPLSTIHLWVQTTDHCCIHNCSSIISTTTLVAFTSAGAKEQEKEYYTSDGIYQCKDKKRNNIIKRSDSDKVNCWVADKDTWICVELVCAVLRSSIRGGHSIRERERPRAHELAWEHLHRNLDQLITVLLVSWLLTLQPLLSHTCCKSAPNNSIRLTDKFKKIPFQIVQCLKLAHGYCISHAFTPH